MITRDKFEQMFPAKRFNENGEIVLTKAAFSRLCTGVLQDAINLVQDKKDGTKVYVFPAEVKKPKASDRIGTIRVEPQVHNQTNRDIRFWSGKAGAYGVKALTHVHKNGSTELRVFVSYKDERGKLRRFRLRTDDVEHAVSRDDLINICKNLTEASIEEGLAM